MFVAVDSWRTSSRLPHCASSEAEDRAGAGQQQALGEQLPRDAQARRAERQAQAELLAARGGARQQQVREVRARDQQHQPDDDHDRQQRPTVARRGDPESPFAAGSRRNGSLR